MKPAQSDLSIVITCYRNYGELKNCLKSLQERLSETSLKIVISVSDNTESSYPEHQQIRELMDRNYPGITLFQRGNVGFGNAANYGITQFPAKYYLVLNADTMILQPQALATMFDFMERHQEVGLAGMRLVHPDNTPQVCCSRFPKFHYFLYRRTPVGKLPFAKKAIYDFHMLDFSWDKTVEVDWCLGSGQLIRDSALAKIGGEAYDETNFWMYLEDMDICRRMWMTGYKVLYFADVNVIHYHGRPSDRKSWVFTIFDKQIRTHLRSWWNYFKKYNFKERPVEHPRVEYSNISPYLGSNSK